MGKRTAVAWWQRPLFAFCSLVFTLLLSIALEAASDFLSEPNLTWGNGGEEQMAGAILILGGITVLATYFLFVVPLVLLCPVEWQLRHWYVMFCAAVVWTLIVIGATSPPTSLRHLRELRALLPITGLLEVFALYSCGCYLLLLRWRHSRAT